MRFAAIVALVSAIALVGGSAIAGTVDDPLATVTSAVPVPSVDDTADLGTVTGTVSGTLNTVSGTTTGSISGGVVSGATSSAPSTGLSGTSGSSSGGSTGSSSSSSPSRERSERVRTARYKTRFDRLPYRLERLLERIERGENVRANIRRLERLFESASPSLRRRVLRLIRAEILRLAGGHTSRRERAAMGRLARALNQLEGRPTSIGSRMPAPVGGGAPPVSASKALPSREQAGLTDPFTGPATLPVRLAEDKESGGGWFVPPGGGALIPWAPDPGLTVSALIFVLVGLSLLLLAFAVAPAHAVPGRHLRRVRQTSGMEIGLASVALILGIAVFLYLQASGAPLP